MAVSSSTKVGPLVCLLQMFVITENTMKHRVYICICIQGVPGGKDLASGECSLGQTIPI